MFTLFFDILCMAFMLAFYVMYRPITGTSMNPARSLAPAIVWHKYKGIWVYLTAPVAGAVSGAWVYHFIRDTEKPKHETANCSTSFLK